MKVDSILKALAITNDHDIDRCARPMIVCDRCSVRHNTPRRRARAFGAQLSTSGTERKRGKGSTRDSWHRWMGASDDGRVG